TNLYNLGDVKEELTTSVAKQVASPRLSENRLLILDCSSPLPSSTCFAKSSRYPYIAVGVGRLGGNPTDKDKDNLRDTRGPTTRSKTKTMKQSVSSLSSGIKENLEQSELEAASKWVAVRVKFLFITSPLITLVLPSSKSWELCFYYLTLVNCYPLMRLTYWCQTSQNLLCCSQLSVIMAEDKVITLGPNELPNLVSSSCLDDHNYLQWAQYIHTILKGRKKLSHIEGNDPPRNDPKFSHYDMAMELYDSINKPELYVLFLCSEIWENLIETYSIKKDSAACYNIESKIFNTRQGTLSIIEYYGALNGLWIELDQIFKFLHGLNFEYNPIRVQILGKEKLPSLFEEKVPQKDQPPKENPSQRVVVENTVHIANDQDIPRILATSFIERRKFLNE
ncbi:hypothetical protein CR513_05302, partial [Mucuna pruriens]